MNNTQLILIAVFAAMSVLDFVLYGVDKAKAKAGAWRIKERTLLGIGVLGGALGGLIGMKTFRHKTKHWYFWAINALALAVHVYVYLYFKG